MLVLRSKIGVKSFDVPQRCLKKKVAKGVVDFYFVFLEFLGKFVVYFSAFRVQVDKQDDCFFPCDDAVGYFVKWCSGDGKDVADAEPFKGCLVFFPLDNDKDVFFTGAFKRGKEGFSLLHTDVIVDEFI